MHARVGDNDDEKSSSSNKACAESNVIAGEQCPSEPSEDNRIEQEMETSTNPETRSQPPYQTHGAARA